MVPENEIEHKKSTNVNAIQGLFLQLMVELAKNLIDVILIMVIVNSNAFQMPVENTIANVRTDSCYVLMVGRAVYRVIIVLGL